ncbi:hypothetical protein T4A_13919 [Trichinella pseudospiralis]|uniref:Uncharacterized protein n=1 Tax=Trichinella pseudospiralis TaxID=6337 RepID=A0A0V1DK58_TRIPS|nr:hypothetical protein T4A_13919 [Trichinella pseudospiralis]
MLYLTIKVSETGSLAFYNGLIKDKYRQSTFNGILHGFKREM